MSFLRIEAQANNFIAPGNGSNHNIEKTEFFFAFRGADFLTLWLFKQLKRS